MFVAGLNDNLGPEFKKRKSMTSENKKITSEPAEKGQSATNKKLPYVKPELHLLNLDGTEGKPSSPVEITFTTTKYGPS